MAGKEKFIELINRAIFSLGIQGLIDKEIIRSAQEIENTVRRYKNMFSPQDYRMYLIGNLLARGQLLLREIDEEIRKYITNSLYQRVKPSDPNIFISMVIAYYICEKANYVRPRVIPKNLSKEIRKITIFDWREALPCFYT